MKQDAFFFCPSQEQYYDFSVPRFVPSRYVCWSQEAEAGEKEIRAYALKSPAFAFLYEQEEDIYSPNDGKPV